MSQMNWDREVDVLVVGTGNGGLTAAVCNWEMGTKDVLIIEKQNKVGGTSATSGGGIWIPNSHYAKEVSLAQALQRDAISVYGKQATGEKYLINPSV